MKNQGIGTIQAPAAPSLGGKFANFDMFFANELLFQ
jgi:hypothetical protein